MATDARHVFAPATCMDGRTYVGSGPAAYYSSRTLLYVSMCYSFIAFLILIHRVLCHGQKLFSVKLHMT